MNNPELITCLREINLSTTERVVAGIVFTVATVAGLVINIMLLLTYHILWPNLKNTVSYHMTLSLAIASVALLTVNLYVQIPCTFTLCTFYYEDRTMIFVVWLESLASYTTTFTNCIIAVERISLFTSRIATDFISKYYRIVIILPWIFGFSVAITTTAIGCYRRYLLSIIAFIFFFFWRFFEDSN